MPKSYLSKSESDELSSNARLVAESAAADRVGDHETAMEWLRQAEIPASALLAAKRSNGAEWIKKSKLQTVTAEAAYGKDWLDRDI